MAHITLVGPLHLAALVALLPPLVSGHGRLLEPPSRTSAWRLGFPTPPHYSDHETNCGGFGRQWSRNGGRCGVCGDPWDQPQPREGEAGGRYGRGVIVRQYSVGETITVSAEITANHKGFFEFRLCPQEDPSVPVTEACLDRHLLRASPKLQTRSVGLRRQALATCPTTLCGAASSEPLSPPVRALRASTCTLDNAAVEAIRPGAASNPANVRAVERVLPESKFLALFPDRSPAYSYVNFLRAVGKFPAVCANPASCPRVLAALLAHIQQETAGLRYTEEIHKGDYCADWSAWVAAAWPCAPGRRYYGRGALQLSWNYNYGSFSRAVLGDAKVLLEQPELVASTWLNFASAIWFFVTPQPPKPSMLQIMDGSWRPNGQDSSAGLASGFGATTVVINGGQECGAGPANPTAAANRERYYRRFAAELGAVVPAGEQLDCRAGKTFPTSGAGGGAALYWAPEAGCTLVTWQTAYSALVEGDHSACRGKAPTCSPHSPQSPPSSAPPPPRPGPSSPLPSPSTTPSSPQIPSSPEATRYYIGPGTGTFSTTLQLPAGLQCPRCVLQWRYVGGNNWGPCPGGGGRVGCGPQEEFRACADITIGAAGGQGSPLRPGATSTKGPWWEATTKRPWWFATTKRPWWSATSTRPWWSATTKRPWWSATSKRPWWSATTKRPWWSASWSWRSLSAGTRVVEESQSSGVQARSGLQTGIQAQPTYVELARSWAEFLLAGVVQFFRTVFMS